jgi:protein-tyrosine phosphatase
MGCLTQVNINSFAEAPRSVRKKLIKLLNSKRIHFIGSDCHNLTSRAPDYSQGIKVIADKCGDDAVQYLVSNANQLVK